MLLDTTIAVPQSPQRSIFNVFPVMLFGMLIFSGASLEWLWPNPNCPYLFHPNVHNWLLLVRITVCRDPHATSSALVLSNSFPLLFFPILFNPPLKAKVMYYIWLSIAGQNFTLNLMDLKKSYLYYLPWLLGDGRDTSIGRHWTTTRSVESALHVVEL